MSVNERGNLVVWTVYQNPSDYPGCFVLRGHEVTKEGSVPMPEVAVMATLDAVRGFVPKGNVRLDRHPDDDPVIVETWI